MSVTKALHSLGLFLVLFGCWAVFSGIFTPFMLGLGAFSCAFAVWAAHRMDVVDLEGHPLHIGWKAPFYWLWLAKEVAVSAFAVTRQVWKPMNRLTPTVAWVPTRQKTDLGLAIFANSITLTPGTVAIEVEKNRILVHALEAGGVDDLESGRMDAKVAQLKAYRGD